MPANHRALTSSIIQISPQDAVHMAETCGNTEAAIMAALFQRTLANIREIIIDYDFNQAVSEIQDLLDLLQNEEETPTLN